MAIKGRTDRNVKMETNARGRPIRLGYLQKGWRDGFGKKIRLHDATYLIFKPLDNGAQGDAMTALFKDVYGEKPVDIPDVRLPVGMAGNFSIEDCAWLLARKHSERGSYFVALSNGESIKQYRNPNTGRVEFKYDGEMPHEKYSKNVVKNEDGDVVGFGALDHKGKLYPWTQEMQIDLILPDFNRALADAGLAGHGVVTLITHSNYDIANLISEYYAALNEVVSLISNPMVPGDSERAKQYLPWRNFPLRLYRSEDSITTPDYRKDAPPGERLLSTRWLVHWQLSPEFSKAAQEAMDKRTQLTLAAVADMPLLQAGQEQHRLAQTNNLLFDEPLPEGVPALPAEALKAHAGPDWESFTADLEAVDGEIVEDDPDEVMGNNGKPEVPPMDWYKETLRAVNLDEWAYRAFQTAEGQLWFDGADGVKRWYAAVCGKYDKAHNEAALGAFRNYANGKGDGVSAPVKAAKAHFEAMRALDGLDEEE